MLGGSSGLTLGSGVSIVLATTLFTNTAPTISGFGTSPSVTSSNGTLDVEINVGTGGTASTGTIVLPTIFSHKWHAFGCQDLTTFSTTVFMTRETASTNNSVTIGNFSSAAAVQPWAASDIISCTIFAR